VQQVAPLAGFGPKAQGAFEGRAGGAGLPRGQEQEGAPGLDLEGRVSLQGLQLRQGLGGPAEGLEEIGLGQPRLTPGGGRHGRFAREAGGLLQSLGRSPLALPEVDAAEAMARIGGLPGLQLGQHRISLLEGAAGIEEVKLQAQEQGVTRGQGQGRRHRPEGAREVARHLPAVGRIGQAIGFPLQGGDGLRLDGGQADQEETGAREIPGHEVLARHGAGGVQADSATAPVSSRAEGLRLWSPCTGWARAKSWCSRKAGRLPWSLWE